MRGLNCPSIFVIWLLVTSLASSSERTALRIEIYNYMGTNSLEQDRDNLSGAASPLPTEQHGRKLIASTVRTLISIHKHDISINYIQDEN